MAPLPGSCSAAAWSLGRCSRQTRAALLVFSCLAPFLGASETPEPWCQTDYDTEVVCHWSVKDAAANCTTDFRLDIRSNNNRNPECVPENRRIPESASPSCFCIIRETSFHGTKYIISLVTGTRKSRDQSVLLRDIVKPRALRNLTVTKTNRHSFILNWVKDYDPSHFLSRRTVLSQVQISSQGQKQPELINVTEQERQREIIAQDLSPGKNYTARVRYQLVEWKSFWSEWSSPCTWSNDVELEPGDNLWWVILLTCFLVTGLIPAFYFCLARLKREWWDEVPNPAKSKMAKDLGKRPCLVMWPMFQGNQEKVPFCATSQDLLERQLSFTDSPSKEGAMFPDQLDEVAKIVPRSGPRGKREAFFTPEVPPVEPSLTVCSPTADPSPGAQMEEEEDHVPHHDALAELFLDILGAEGSAEDAETPQPVLEDPPPARAPDSALGNLCLFGETPKKSPGGSSQSGYQNTSLAPCPRASSPAPKQCPGDGQPFSASQYKLLLFPQQLPSAPYRGVVTDSLGPQSSSGGPMTPQLPSCYKSFSSLLAPPTASCHQLWKHELDFQGVDQAQLLSRWPLSCGEGLLFPPQQEAPSQNAREFPCSVELCLSGYRPFRPALPPSAASQDPCCLSSDSPYKLLHGVFKDVPNNGSLDPVLRAREAGPAVPWEEPLTFAFSRCVEE